MGSATPGQGASTKLDPYTIYTLAAENGFSTVGSSKYGGYSEAEVATAVALAESGGNPNNVGDQSLAKNGSLGLWQIYTGAHQPNEFGLMGGWTPSNVAALKNPITNAKAAYAVFKSQGFGTPGKPGAGWTTYSTGAYKQYLMQAKAASLQANRIGGSTGNLLVTGPVNDQGAPTSGNDTTAAGADVASSVSGIFSGLVGWLEGGFIRVAYFLGGAVLLIFFLWKAGGS